MSDATAVAEAAQPAVATEPVVVEAKEVTAEKTETEETEKTEAEKTEKTEETEKPDEKPEETKTEAEKTETEKTEKTEKDEAKTGKEKGPNNRKFDPSVLPASEDHAIIQTQVHFYFSDSNLPTDKYLWELTGGPENKPVELKKICQFGRMRRFPSYETVVAALRQSKFLVLSGEAGHETVARKHPYNADRPRSKVDAATVYAKGFGDEEPSTQFDLEAFFTQFGSVNAVRLRRTADNLFKGSVFVEFADAEQAEKFLALDPVPKWKDQDLKIMSKSAYVAEKSQLIREGKLEPSNNSAPRFYEGKIMNGRRNGRGGHSADKDDWKKRRDDDRKNGFRGGRGGGRGRGGRGGRGRGNWNNNYRNGHNNRQNGPPQDATYGKRSREEDNSNGASEPPAKKVDAKLEATTEAA